MVRRRLQQFVTAIDPYLLLLLLLTLVALTPLAAPGYFYAAHDGRHSVFYLSMFVASLRDGALWPTWGMHHIQGYGYPTFLIQAPIGFYIGAFFVWLGAGYTTAVKLTWSAGFIFSGWGMYHLVGEWLQHYAQPIAAETTAGVAEAGNTDEAAKEAPATNGARGRWVTDLPRSVALIAALIYIFIPYRFVDTYVRAALNDTLLLAWFPWVLWAFDRLLRNGGTAGWPRRLALATLLLGGVLLTHTFALVSFAPFVVSFVLFHLLFHLCTRQEQRWRGTLERMVLAGAAGAGALLLCVAFLLPLFWEGRHLDQQVYVTDTYDFRRHFVQLGQYFSPFWGFGYSDDPVGANDGMSFQVGLLPLILCIVGTALPWPVRSLRWLAGYLAVMTLALLLFMSPLAQPLWEAVPALAVIQFPWRLLSLVILSITPLAGLALFELIRVSQPLRQPSAGEQSAGVILVVTLVILSSYPYIGAELEPVEPWREDGRAVYRFEQEHPDMIAYTEWVQDRPFTTSVMSEDYAAADYTEINGYTADLTRLSIMQGVGTVVSQYSRGSSFGGTVRLTTPALVRVNLYYFPGWEVQLDGQPANYRISEQHGLIEIDVPAGEHQIDVRMGTTLVRQIGMGISGGTLAVLLLLLAWPRERRE